MLGPGLIMHGGAGDLGAALTEDALAGCRRPVEAGLIALAAGPSAVDAVCAAVRILEDDPTLNAGTGSALTRDGTVEGDAAVMDGHSARIGAVAAMANAGQAVSNCPGSGVERPVRPRDVARLSPAPGASPVAPAGECSSRPLARLTPDRGVRGGNGP
jgi:hypothetical protein